MTTSREGNESWLVFCKTVIEREDYPKEVREYYKRDLDQCMELRKLYASDEVQMRPRVDYGDWIIIFQDDQAMIKFLESEMEENDLSYEEVYIGVNIEYVPMSGVELGDLPELDR